MLKNRIIMLWLIICCTALFTSNCKGTLEANLIVTFAKQFRAPQPLRLFYDVPKETRIKFIKSVSKEDFTLDWIDELKDTEKFLLVISENDGHLGRDENINIDQQIYFLTASLDIYEKYKINNELIQQKLGHFSDGTYIPEESIEQNFLKRRQSFHGLKMIAVVGNGHTVQIENLKDAPYFPINGTYDVTGLVKGPWFNVWAILQKNLNFTTKMYTRKDRKWDVPTQYPNGSISVPDGIIKNGMDGSADILLAKLAIIYYRYLAIDYLVPLENSENGIFVSKDAIGESLDFEVFQKPFDKWTWITLISSSMIVAVSIALTFRVLNQGKLNCLNFMDIFAKSLKAYFGHASFMPISNRFFSPQIVIFVVLITGNIIWIAYNGALLSKLVKPKLDKPFHDLESLAESNFR